MFKFTMKSFLVLFVFALFSSNLLAEDIVKVQTLSFDSITTRRAIWQFPNNDDTYRKILMRYRLKCDVKTTRDRFNCGEWDYLTHTNVYKHTGVMDSTLKKHFLYRIGNQTPEKIELTNTPLFNTVTKKYKKAIIDKVQDVKECKFGSGKLEMALNMSNFHAQYIVNESEFAAAGLVPGRIFKMQIEVKTPGTVLKNVTIRVANNSTDEQEEMEYYDYIDVYKGDLTFDKAGWHEIIFQEEFTLRKKRNLFVDISFQSDKANPTVLHATKSGMALVSATDKSNYLSFDGNDMVDCGLMPELNAKQKITFESWIKYDKWQNWSNILSKSGMLKLEAGGTKGELYLRVRNTANAFGRAFDCLVEGKWAHVAMVFDGTKATNKERLKLYINGNEKALIYLAEIPKFSNTNDEPFLINTKKFIGGIDDVRIWDDALTKETIKAWRQKALDDSHPNSSTLLAHYDMEDDGTTLVDKSKNSHDGVLIGIPTKTKFLPKSFEREVKNTDIRPNMTFFQGGFFMHLEDVTVIEKVAQKMVSVETLEVINFAPTRKAIKYAYMSGYELNIDADGKETNGKLVPAEETLTNKEFEYYAKPFEVIETIEIARYITPYGINLDLGPEGFEWIYDVTDYAHLLKGDVDISAGNQQELIDLSFDFIKGTPPRTVKQIDRIWGPRKSYRYKDLASDAKLSKQEVKLHKDAKEFKVKTRFTGHGHARTNDTQPHCCEWKNNLHTLIVNDTKAADWRIWQACGLNPVSPQGGNWPGAREGWCPGDVVKDYEFEVTKMISGNKATFDYDITDVPTDNPGMGNGDYHIAMHLVQYGDLNFDKDVEVYDILLPTSRDHLQKMSPSCQPPVIVLRNNGKETVTNLKIEYTVSGGKKETLDWNGELVPHVNLEVTLPLDTRDFWGGDDQHLFTVTAILDGDKYADNDTQVTKFTLPDLFAKTSEISLEFKTNSIPINGGTKRYTLEIFDVTGETVHNTTYSAANTVHVEKLFEDLDIGCYRLKIRDQACFGLKFWMIPNQGEGYVRIVDKSGKVVKNFNPDFGCGFDYAFSIGAHTLVSEPNFDFVTRIAPNPVTDQATVSMDINIGEASFEIYDLAGTLISKETVQINGAFSKTINTSNFNKGLYFVRIKNGTYNFTKKFIVK